MAPGGPRRAGVRRCRYRILTTIHTPPHMGHDSGHRHGYSGAARHTVHRRSARAAAPGAVRAALHRGRIVHRLLESLPEIPAENRRFVAEKYLAAFAGEALDPAAQAALLVRVLAILDDPEFAAVFAAGSRAEVEIAGNIKGLSISGRIDRLAVADDRVLIVDYKTNRPAPENLAAVPPAYITQLALYRLVLSRLYPDRRVAAALLWTEIPRLMEVPEAMLLAAESALFA